MKKFFTFGFVLAVALLVTNKAHADTATSSSVDLPCTVINVNLCPDSPNSLCPSNLYKPGATNDKDFYFKDWKPVATLQKFLIKAGYLKAGSATGTYGATTKAAITRFQKDYGVKDTVGYAGPATRAQVKKLSCGLDKTLPDFKIDSVSFSTTTSLTVKADIVVKNIGYEAASSSAIHGFTGVSDGTATLASSTCSTLDLPVGASCTVSYNLVFKKGGRKELVAKADTKNKVSESSENNNILKKKLDIKLPGSTSGTTGGSGGGTTGSTTPVTALTVSNINISGSKTLRDSIVISQTKSCTFNNIPSTCKYTEKTYTASWSTSGVTSDSVVVPGKLMLVSVLGYQFKLADIPNIASNSVKFKTSKDLRTSAGLVVGNYYQLKVVPNDTSVTVTNGYSGNNNFEIIK